MSATEQPTEQVGSLPESAKEETKEQFEKLKEHNKQLSDKLAALEAQQQPKFNSVLDEVPFQSPALSNLSTAQVEDPTAGLVDDNGYIDQNLLNRTLHQANDKAQRAEDRAILAERRIEKFEETQEVRDVHGKHPTLDPYNPNFNQDFYNRVKNEVGGQLKKGYQDFKAAADKVASELKAQSATQVPDQTTVEQQRKVVAQREQANPTGSGKVNSTSSHENVEDGLRKGDSLSIGQMLQANGY